MGYRLEFCIFPMELPEHLALRPVTYCRCAVRRRRCAYSENRGLAPLLRSYHASWHHSLVAIAVHYVDMLSQIIGWYQIVGWSRVGLEGFGRE